MASYDTGTSCPGKQTNKQVELHNVTELDIFNFSVLSLLSLKIRWPQQFKLPNLIDYKTVFKWQKWEDII
jgi:hypothetical protein